MLNKSLLSIACVLAFACSFATANPPTDPVKGAEKKKDVPTDKTKTVGNGTERPAKTADNPKTTLPKATKPAKEGVETPTKKETQPAPPGKADNESADKPSYGFLNLTRPGPPNILLILIDTLRSDHLGIYGYKHNTSPNIDALARKGVVFEQSRSTGPSTRFSVPPILVGKWLTEMKRTNAFWTKISKSEILITQHLKRAAYTTAAVHSIDYFRKRFGMARGFDHYDDSCIKTVSKETRKRNMWMHCLWYRATSRYITRRTLRLIKRQKLDQKKPFFLWTYYSDPHGPYIRHRGFKPPGGLYRHRYDGEIMYTDHWIGKMLESLEKKGMLKNTVIILTSDHGEGLSKKEDHGSLKHSANLYDELLKVPLIIVGPGIKPRRVKTPVSIIDIPSTMMELAGLPPSPAHRGMSLVPYLKGENPPHPPLYFEKHRREDAPEKAMLKWPYKVIGKLRTKRTKIYDLEKDPKERRRLKKSDLPPGKYDQLVKDLWHWVHHIRKGYKDHYRH